MTDEDLVRLLLDARQGAPVPNDAVPEDAAQAYRVQALVMAQLGEIGGWKVGAAGPEAPIACAPMPCAGIAHSPARFDPAVFTQREVESEICFTLAVDLPSREAPYGRAEVLAALGTCHPGIEVLQSRYADPAAAGALAGLADLIQHGGYVVGAPLTGWRDLDFASLPVVQTVADGPVARAVGNPAGDMLRLLIWLANTGAAWAGGLRAGQVVTCGSWTGKTAVAAGGSATAAFGGAEAVLVEFRAG